MGWLDHRELRIVRGVYIAPGDTNSVEPAIVELNLLSNNTGIALTADGWTPNIPSLKNGGVWADSPISDGRTLISGVNGNVTETMRLVITGGTYKEAAGYLAALNNMIRDCRDFWQANAQIDPVYIQWFASCGTGRQYALIYNMDFDAEYKDSPTPQIEGTLTIERECYWRAIPPGANPKQWRYEFYGQVYNYANTVVPGNLGNSSDDLIQSGVLQNRSEWTTNALASLKSNNCVTIAASLIPGDAPALMTMYNTSSTRNNFIMGKKTRKIPMKLISQVFQNAIFNLNDGTLGVNATLANDTGASLAAGSATAQRLEVSFATATNQLRWNIGTSLSGNGSINRFIGRWMVFLRCRQSAGTLGDITMYLRYGSAITADTDGVKLNVVSPPVIAGAGNTTNWGLVYMGIINIPSFPGKASVNAGGNAPAGGGSNGLNGNADSSFDLGLFALRSAGVGLLYANDIILIPVDEGSITMEGTDTTTDSGILYDETGYYSHGTPDIIVNNSQSTAGATKGAKMTGTGIQLTPNVENKLYFVFYDSSTQSRVSDTVTFDINIVPRCTGIRGF